MRIRRTSEEWRALYLEFLHSPDWARKRALVIQRAQGRCECCSVNSATEVHHVTYPQKRSGALTMDDFIHQPNWQLRAICRPCHQRETEARS